MATNTVTFKEATETIANLNASLDISNNVPSDTCGTFALIENVISNLVSIKNSLKTEEKKIIADMAAHMKQEGDGTNTMGPETTFESGAALTMTVADLQATDGIGDDGSARHEDTVVTATLPAVLIVNSKEYSESAVFAVLAQAAQHIDKLKNGISTGAITVTETTTLA